MTIDTLLPIRTLPEPAIYLLLYCLEKVFADLISKQREIAKGTNIVLYIRPLNHVCKGSNAICTHTNTRTDTHLQCQFLVLSSRHVSSGQPPPVLTHPICQ